VQYFAHRYCADPDELAQETTYRVLAKLSAGQVIQGEKGFEKFCYACARHVWQESLKVRGSEELPDTFRAPAEQTTGLSDVDFNLWTGELLARLDQPEQELATHAIQGTLDELAPEGGIAIKRLRVRLSRLRKKLRNFRDGAS
jgi:DNA-directed RNA polymerase specialized sigma24 family protein